jgi:hypothetical protein
MRDGIEWNCDVAIASSFVMGRFRGFKFMFPGKRVPGVREFFLVDNRAIGPLFAQVEHLPWGEAFFLLVERLEPRRGK